MKSKLKIFVYSQTPNLMRVGLLLLSVILWGIFYYIYTSETVAVKGGSRLSKGDATLNYYLSLAIFGLSGMYSFINAVFLVRKSRDTQS